MKYICPLLVVSDMQRSRKFYEDILEQKVKADFGENVTFEGDFAIHLDSHYTGLIESKKITWGGNDFELYFEEDVKGKRIYTYIICTRFERATDSPGPESIT